MTQWFSVPNDKPTLTLRDVAVRDSLNDDPGVDFVAIQTAFEGFDVNTLERAKDVARQYVLDIPFGRDPGPDGRRSLVMQRNAA